MAGTAEKKNTWGLGGLRGTGGELGRLVVDYIKQETLQPLKGLGRYLGLGIAGAVCLSAGLVVLGVAFLRLLQAEVPAFDGNLSWLPYLLLTVVVVAVAALAVWRITKSATKPTTTTDEERP